MRQQAPTDDDLWAILLTASTARWGRFVQRYMDEWVIVDVAGFPHGWGTLSQLEMIVAQWTVEDVKR